MLHVQEGQCGLCTHFGEDHELNKALIEIRSSKEAEGDFINDCLHPKHAPLHLRVTAISACDGFQPVVHRE